MSVVVDRLVLEPDLLLILFIEGGRGSFDFDGLLVVGLGDVLLTAEVGLGDAVGHANDGLGGCVVEDEGVVVEVDAGLAVS